MTFVDDEGNEIETSGEIAITKQSVSFFNSKIKGDVSTTFTIDNNSKNRKTLGYYGPQMLNQIAYTKQAFNRVRNGNVLDRGFIVIQNDNGPTLSCFYVSGNSNWVQLFEGIITQLDYTGRLSKKNYLVKFDNTNIVASKSNTDGVIFPLVDWCYNYQHYSNYYTTMESYRYGDWPNLTGKMDVNQDPEKPFYDLYPCFYIHTLIDEIFSQSGLKRNGSLFDDQLYKSIVLTPVNGLIKRQAFKNITAFGSSQTISSGPGLTYYSSLTEFSDPDNLFENNAFTSDKFISAYFYLTIESRSSNNINALALYKNGVFLQQFTINFTGETYKSSLQNCIPGDTFTFYVNNNAAGSQTATINIRIEFPVNISGGDWINPSDFLPEMKSLDLIKFVINYFGCSVYYEDTSKTITINIIEKIIDNYNWSDYYLSHRLKYTVDQSKNNYVRFLKNELDNSIKSYNSINKIKFGEGNIQTQNTLKTDSNLFTIPFQVNGTQLTKAGIYLTSVPLINLVDEGDPIAFTSITSGLISTSNPTQFHNNEVVRIVDSNGYNLGYIEIYYDFDLLNLYSEYTFTLQNSGKIYRQKLEYQEIEPSFLIVRNVNISDLGDQSNIVIYDNYSTDSTQTSFPVGYFTKQKTGFGIDSIRYNLAIDNPNSGQFEDPTIKELYFNKISRFLQNPDIECEMLLPEAVFQRFKFDRFIYLKTENLTGYFFVESIENYIDGNTPVTVNLYML